MDIETIILKIKQSLIKRRFILIPVYVLGVIGFLLPFVELFGIDYSPGIGILVLATAIVISVVLIIITLMQNRDIDGIRTFYSSRNELTNDYWKDFFLKRTRPQCVYLLGHSLSKTFAPDKLETFIEWCNSGTKFKILLLSYKNTEISQLLTVGKGIQSILGKSPNVTLIEKIKDTHEKLEKEFISRIPDIANKPQLRFATCNLPFSINAVDDDMLVTIYGTIAEADQQPTLFINGKHTKSYESFLSEFSRIWENHSKVIPEIDPIIRDLKKNWQDLLSLNNYSGSIPSPMQAIIYPTYRCEEDCEYCMFKSKRDNAVSRAHPDMTIKTFKKILDEISENEIKFIEISGGGEPLEHPEFEQILDQLIQFRSLNPEVKIGLLTNGIHLNDFDPGKLLHVFNDYIRISRYEKVLSKTEYDQFSSENAAWEDNISRLMDHKNDEDVISTKIGIKYLLNRNNQEDFISLVQRDLDKPLFRRFDHYRFKAERRIDNSKITTIENDIYYSIQKHEIPHIKEKLSISLTNYCYPPSFKCWISPISCVFSPEGKLYICCNFIHDEDSKTIGNITKSSFHKLWNSKKHLNLRKNLVKEHCSREDYTNCRFAEVQDILDHFHASIGDIE